MNSHTCDYLCSLAHMNVPFLQIKCLLLEQCGKFLKVCLEFVGTVVCSYFVTVKMKSSESLSGCKVRHFKQASSWDWLGHCSVLSIWIDGQFLFPSSLFWWWSSWLVQNYVYVNMLREIVTTGCLSDNTSYSIIVHGFLIGYQFSETFLREMTGKNFSLMQLQSH